jgi:hypothetical protein
MTRPGSDYGTMFKPRSVYPPSARVKHPLKTEMGTGNRAAWEAAGCRGVMMLRRRGKAPRMPLRPLSLPGRIRP